MKISSKKNNDQDEEMDTGTSVLISGPRPKHEDKEAKMNRKKAIKEERRVGENVLWVQWGIFL